MSNEELVKLIQKGERDKILSLWEGVKLYIAKVANSYVRLTEGKYAEFDDLIQSGFIAMVEAAESFDIDGEAKFITWLSYYIKTAFAEAMNRKTPKQRKDPIHNAQSLLTPLFEDESGETTLQDTIAAPDAFEDIERKIYLEQLHEALEDVLQTIPQDRADVLRQHFFESNSLTDIARKNNVSIERVRAIKHNGLQNIRRKIRTSQGAKLRAYIEEETNYYSGMGYMAFVYSQTSPIEHKVLQRQRLENEFVNAQYQQQLYESRKHSGIIRAQK